MNKKLKLSNRLILEILDLEIMGLEIMGLEILELEIMGLEILGLEILGGNSYYSMYCIINKQGRKFLNSWVKNLK